MKQDVSKNNKKNKTRSRKLKKFYLKLSLIFLIITCVVIAIVFFLKSNYLLNTISKINYYKNLSIQKMDLKVQNIFLEGEYYTGKQTILKTMKINMGDYIFDIDLKRVRHDLEQLPWIKQAIVERRLPNTIYVLISEKKPVALWQYKGKVNLIDENNNIIIEKNLKQFTNLLLVVGSDANIHANNLINVIGKDEKLYNKISSAIRINERRWNIRFDNNLEVKMPGSNFEEAWEYLLIFHQKQNIFQHNIASIDLRIPDKLYISYWPEKHKAN